MSGNVIPLHPEGFAASDTAEEFLSFFLRERRESTAHAYFKDLCYLGEYLELSSVVDVVRFLLNSPSLLVNRRVQDWKSAMLDRSLSPNTIKRRLGTVRSLLSVARSLGLSRVELSVRNVPLYRVKDAHSPTRETIARMIQLLSHDNSPQAARSEALVRLAYEMGLRRLEICLLDLHDLDTDNSRITITGKCRRETMSLTSTCCTAIERWLSHRGYWQGPLFVSLSSNSLGHRLSGTSVYRIIRETGERAGSPLPVPPHSLRRSAINRALGITGIRETCEFSRHRDIRSLQEYMDADDNAQGQISTALAAGLDIANATVAAGDKGHDME